MKTCSHPIAVDNRCAFCNECVSLKEKTTLRLLDWRGFLTNDYKCKISETLLSHLNPNDDRLYVDEHFKGIRAIAIAHGWDIVLRIATKKELRELSE